MQKFPRGFARWLLLLAAAMGFAVAGAGAAASPRTVVCFGDSLTAGYGLGDASSEAYPALLQAKIDAAGLGYRVVNAGLTGETSSGGLRRIDWILRVPVDVFVLALGSNDGLRGIDPSVTRRNLEQIIDRVRARNPRVRIVLAGLQLPPEMGPDFTRAFAELFPALAAEKNTGLIPFLLEGVGGNAKLNLGDRVHPNAAGHEVMAETVWRVLRPLL